MPIPEVSERVARRLLDLHQRHLPVEEGRVTSYYDSARGYYGPELAGAERDQFGIAMATLDGELHTAGALVTTDLVRGKDPAEKLERIVGTLRVFADNHSIDVDPDIFAQRDGRS